MTLKTKVRNKVRLKNRQKENTQQIASSKRLLGVYLAGLAWPHSSLLQTPAFYGAALRMDKCPFSILFILFLRFESL